MIKTSVILIFILGLVGDSAALSSKLKPVPELDDVNRSGGTYDASGLKPFAGDGALKSMSKN